MRKGSAAAQDKCETEIGQGGNCLKEARVLNIVYRLIGLVAPRNTFTPTHPYAAVAANGHAKCTERALCAPCETTTNLPLQWRDHSNSLSRDSLLHSADYFKMLMRDTNDETLLCSLMVLGIALFTPRG